jgi:hypothetical protein
MKAVVVYESMFGDTRQVAQAIGDGLGLKYEVAVVPVSAVTIDHLTGVDLLVVGGPTHVRGMSRPQTREGAVNQASQPESGITLEPGAAGRGLREWFSSLTDTPRYVAAFDTRVQMSSLVTGRAAPKIARSLQRSGSLLIAEPESFLVTTKQPALVTGELERARAWGETLAIAGAQFMARSNA